MELKIIFQHMALLLTKKILHYYNKLWFILFGRLFFGF